MGLCNARFFMGTVLMLGCAWAYGMNELGPAPVSAMPQAADKDVEVILLDFAVAKAEALKTRYKLTDDEAKRVSQKIEELKREAAPLQQAMQDAEAGLRKAKKSKNDSVKAKNAFCYAKAVAQQFTTKTGREKWGLFIKSILRDERWNDFRLRYPCVQYHPGLESSLRTCVAGEAHFLEAWEGPFTPKIFDSVTWFLPWEQAALPTTEHLVRAYRLSKDQAAAVDAAVTELSVRWEALSKAFGTDDDNPTKKRNAKPPASDEKARKALQAYQNGGGQRTWHAAVCKALGAEKSKAFEKDFPNIWSEEQEVKQADTYTGNEK